MEKVTDLFKQRTCHLYHEVKGDAFIFPLKIDNPVHPKHYRPMIYIPRMNMMCSSMTAAGGP